MPYYIIRHITRFRYNAPVRENITEARMQPRTEDHQRCLKFSLDISPRAHVVAYQDYLGNIIHHFDIPALHVEQKLTAEALVEVDPPPSLPERLETDTWQTISGLTGRIDLWDYLKPSRFTQPTPLLHTLLHEFNLSRAADPLTMLKTLNQNIFQTFGYAPQTTRVDSPIDDAIAARRGVCQDFTHILIALARQMGIPCRYVSGYLYHRQEDHDRSADDATHAWAEAFLPCLGWIGFDPTNNLLSGERHIKVAIGRDYADVPPTRGVFVGNAQEMLSVGVHVTLASVPQKSDDAILPDTPWSPPPLKTENTQWQQQQQQ